MSLRRLACVLAAAVFLPACAATAETPPPDLARVVTDDLNAQLLARGAHDPGDDTPEGAGGHVRSAPAAMFRQTDVNADGVDDWIVDYERAPNPSFFCGSGGCQKAIYVSRAGGGYQVSFQRTAGPIVLRREEGRTRLDVEFHGSVCGGAGADRCARSYVWSDAQRRWDERPNVLGETFLHGPIVQTPAVPRTEWPTGVRTALADVARACAAAGGALEAADPESIPDLNGDGRRDWVVGGPYSYCEGAQEVPLPLIVLVTQGTGGEVRQGLRITGHDYGVDIAGDLATFVLMEQRPDCPLRGCPQQRLGWNATAGELRPR